MILQKRIYFHCCSYQMVRIKKGEVREVICPNCGYSVTSKKFVGKINQTIRETIRHSPRAG